MRTYIVYKDVAPDAEQYATVTGTELKDDSAPSSLLTGLENIKAITLEHNGWTLDSTYKLYDSSKVALWSEELSDADGLFTDNPSVTFSLSQQFSSVGVTITFDTVNNEYCDEIVVRWYQGTTLKSEETFYPDSTVYFCDNTVESYDKIVIEFVHTSHPFKRARMEAFMFGIVRNFGMDEIRDAKLVGDCNIISLELPVNKFAWTLDSIHSVEYLFQLKQPVEVVHDGELLGTYYVSSASRKDARLYEIECEDALGVLDAQTFSGNYYNAVSAQSILSAIVGSAFAIEYADDVADMTLTGIIEACSKREAIQQVCFAWGVLCTTDGTNKLRISKPSSTATHIADDYVFYGDAVDYESIVTSVQLYYHTYTANSIQSGILINGTYYTDTKTLVQKDNPNVTANDIANVIEIEDATLVSSSNAQAVLNRVYDYYMKRATTKNSIVWNGEKLGDCVSFDTNWNTVAQGNIVKMDIKLSNLIVADIETLGSEVD